MFKKIMYCGVFAVFLASCSNDFDLIDNKKEIPVIYGILSKQDSAHYIRIERAFADENTSAVELAKNIDSLYYKDISVQLIRAKDNKVYTLKQVDGNKEGYKRKSGIFVESPNYLYKIKESDINLETNEVYKLVVKRKDGTLITEAQTIIVPDMKLSSRTLFGSKLNVRGVINVFWESQDALNAKMYDVQMIVQFIEIPKDGSPNKTIKLVWNLAKNYIPDPNRDAQISNNTIKYKMEEGYAFYRFLDQQLSTAKPATRKLEHIKIRVDAGGNELYEYINIGIINTGITLREVLPTYSNIKNGYGVLSSKNHFISNELLLDNPSLDSLLNGSITKKYGFIN